MRARRGRQTHDGCHGMNVPEMLAAPLFAMRDFLELGGDVLLLVAAVSFVMWGLMFERALYLFGGHRVRVRAALAAWEARSERRSWHARRVREELVSRVAVALQSRLQLIRTLVMLCPLLGLLGTVTGMIEVFETLAVHGGGNARAMAAGVAKATVPTMAGMVVALSGLFISSWLQRRAELERTRLAEHLTMDH